MSRREIAVNAEESRQPKPVRVPKALVVVQVLAYIRRPKTRREAKLESYFSLGDSVVEHDRQPGFHELLFEVDIFFLRPGLDVLLRLGELRQPRNPRRFLFPPRPPVRYVKLGELQRVGARGRMSVSVSMGVCVCARVCVGARTHTP